jgi:hypothetical protein
MFKRMLRPTSKDATAPDTSQVTPKPSIARPAAQTSASISSFEDADPEYISFQPTLQQPVSSSGDKHAADDLDSVNHGWSSSRKAKNASFAAKGAQSMLGKKDSDDARKAAPGTMTHRRAILSSMSHDELTAEVTRFGRRGVRGEQVRPVLEELLRRTAQLPHNVIRDAIYVAHEAGLHRLAVTIYIARAKTHERDSHFSLYEVVVDSAHALGSADTIAQVCRAIQPKLSFSGASEVPSEQSLYRALWRLTLLAQQAMRTQNGDGKAARALSTYAQCMDAARTVFNVILSYDKDRVLDSCNKRRYATYSLCDRDEVYSRLAARAASVATPPSTSSNKQTLVSLVASTNSRSSLPDGEEDSDHIKEVHADPVPADMTPDEAFTHFMQRIARITKYGGDRGELAFTLMVHDEYCSREKRHISPATRYTSLFRACRASGRGDTVHAYFIEYLQLLDTARYDAEMQKLSEADRAARHQAGYHSPSDVAALLEANIAAMEEIVVHGYCGAMNHCKQYEKVVELAKLTLQSPSLKHRYIPSASVLALMMRAIGETQSSAVADTALDLLLNPPSGAAPSSHEIFLSLMGLAKCGLPSFQIVLDACISNDLIEGGAEERGYLLMQHALNTQDPVAAMKTVEASMVERHAPISERMMVLFLQCLLRTESDEFLAYFKRFCEGKGGVEYALPSWIELLVRWSERRCYELSDVDRKFIVEDVLVKHGFDDPDGNAATHRLEASYKKQLLTLLHDHMRQPRQKLHRDGVIGAAPETKDPRLFFVTQARHLLNASHRIANEAQLHSPSHQPEVVDMDAAARCGLAQDVVVVSEKALHDLLLPLRAAKRLDVSQDAKLLHDDRVGLQTVADRLFDLPEVDSSTDDDASAVKLERTVSINSEIQSIVSQQRCMVSTSTPQRDYEIFSHRVGRLPRPAYRTWGDVLRMTSDEFEVQLQQYRSEHLRAGTLPARSEPMQQ